MGVARVGVFEQQRRALFCHGVKPRRRFAPVAVGAHVPALLRFADNQHIDARSRIQSGCSKETGHSFFDGSLVRAEFIERAADHFEEVYCVVVAIFRNQTDAAVAQKQYAENERGRMRRTGKNVGADNGP